MKLNDGKCQLLTFGAVQNNIKIKIEEGIVEESSKEKLLGMITDKKRNFESHILSLCKRASQRVHALARVSTFIDPRKLRLLMSSFVNAQFSYCHLIWMFHDRNLNAKVNNIHGRALRIIYKDTHAEHEASLKLDSVLSIHQRNLQYLMTEMYKTKTV